MKIKITADSTCDLSPELIEKYDIGIIPLYVTQGSSSFKDGIDIVPERIFADIEAGGELYKTSAVNIPDYIDYFTECLKEYDAVIHINISSDFSVCYQNACIAASALENVYVVDSKNLSTGSALLVIDAAIMAAEGEAPEIIAEKLRESVEKIDASFVIDTLKFLHRGGRCSGVAALGANLLKLKPCIEVKDGKMEVGKKYRGNLDKVLPLYIKDHLSKPENVDSKRVFITYSPTTKEEYIEAAKKAVNEFGSFKEILETTAGCTISAHCGPNTLGILFYKK